MTTKAPDQKWDFMNVVGKIEEARGAALAGSDRAAHDLLPQ
jgi:hypothetical protein